jgi:energy-coupling factor transporter ATP-binding protein EcfA2
VADRRLIERLANGVFDPPVAYDDLADHHLDFEALADARPEAEIRERAERESGCCAVVGRTGSGKSSLIAAVAASLSPTRFPVRVQGINDASALTREGFALLIARETLRAVEALPTGRPRGKRLRHARERLASTKAQARGGHGVALSLPLPGEFTAELRTTAQEVVEERDATSIAQAIEQLVRVTERFDRRLLLVVEDTDVFMPPEPINHEESERPTRFVNHVVTYLARDFPSSSLVAVNDRYRDLVPAGTVAVVQVPVLRVDAIGRLLEHYAKRSGLYVKAEQIAHPQALSYAAGRYANNGDVRRTLALFHKAARKMAGEGRGEPITDDVLHGL